MPLSLLFVLTLAVAALAMHRDRRMIDEALAHSGPAWAQLVRRLMPVIQARTRRWLWRVGGGAAEVEDLAQQVWLRLLEAEGRALRAYDPERGMSLEGYVGLVAEREAGNLLAMGRAQKRGGGRVTAEADAGLNTGDPRTGPEAAATQRNTLGALLAHLDTALPVRGQLVLRLLYVDGHAPPEAAAALGVSLQVVHNWQHRIRELARAWQQTHT